MVSNLTDDNRMVFAVGETGQILNGKRIPLIIMGITRKAFKFLMAGDNFQQFDFTRQGVPTYMMVIAGETRAHVLDKMSPMMSGPKVADMHSPNLIPQSEQAIPQMMARARDYIRDKLHLYEADLFTDEEMHGLINSILRGND